MNDTWAFRLSFFASHLLFKLGIAWVWAFSLLLGPCSLLSYIRRLASALATPLHCSYYDITYPFTCCYLWACELKHLPCQLLILFVFLDFTAQHSCWASSFRALGILGPFHSLGILGHFILPYLFHSHGFLLNPLKFPGPITTSLPFRLIGLCANPMNLLIPFLGFPSPFLLSLHLLQFPWAYYFIPWAFLTHLLSFWPLIIFVGPLTTIPAILA